MGINRDIKALCPAARLAWLDVEAELEAMGIKVKVVETRRMDRIQRAYYAQGRETLAEVNLKRNAAGLWSITAKQNRKITWTMESMHFYDVALDFALVDAKGKLSWDTKADINEDDIGDYHNVGAIAKKHGFEWGGDFKGKDYAHLQFMGGLTIEDLRAGKRPKADIKTNIDLGICHN